MHSEIEGPDDAPVVGPSQYAALREAWPRAEAPVVPAGGHGVQLRRHPLVRPALAVCQDGAKEV